MLFNASKCSSNRAVPCPLKVTDCAFTRDNHFLLMLQSIPEGSQITIYNIVNDFVKQHVKCPNNFFKGLEISPDDAFIACWDKSQ